MFCYFYQNWYVIFVGDDPKRFILVDYEVDEVTYHASGLTFERDRCELHKSESFVIVNRRLLILWDEIFERTMTIPPLHPRDHAFLACKSTLQEMMALPDDDAHLAALMSAGFHWGAAKSILATWRPHILGLSDAAVHWLLENPAHPRNFMLENISDAAAHVRKVLE